MLQHSIYGISKWKTHVMWDYALHKKKRKFNVYLFHYHKTINLQKRCFTWPERLKIINPFPSIRKPEVVYHLRCCVVIQNLIYYRFLDLNIKLRHYTANILSCTFFFFLIWKENNHRSIKSSSFDNGRSSTSLCLYFVRWN